MLYLAEIQKKSRVLGTGKVELKLLACQRTESSWSVVPGEEIIPAPDDANYNAGILVMVELTASKQVQRHFEAGRQLVSILQNFSRLQEKAKTQEEEIEQWKQSLTYQSQELNRREMEIETRQDQLQEMEETFKQLEQQRQEIEAQRQEANQLRDEFERKSQELEGAWAHLRGEMSRLEEQQAQFQQSASLDDEQSRHLQDLLNRLSGTVIPTESVREQLSSAFEVMAQQQGMFDQYLEELAQQRATAQQLQDDVDQQAQTLRDRWQEWQQAQTTLEQVQAEFTTKQGTLVAKQYHLEGLTEQLRSQDELYQQVLQLATTSDHVRIGAKIEVEVLEKLSLEDLQAVVREREDELEKMSRFVSSQEEELVLQQETIQELQGQIQQANEYDRLRMETELADEQDRYQMLNKTLVGQRRNLHERGEVLKQYQLFLSNRQGIATVDAQEPAIDLGPVLARIEEVRDQQTRELNRLQDEIQALQSAVGQSQYIAEQQAQEQQALWSELEQLEEQWHVQKSTVAELWSKVNFSQEALQPLQDGSYGLRQNLDTISTIMNQFQEATDYQLQAIAEMQQIIQNLTENSAPEFVAS